MKKFLFIVSILVFFAIFGVTAKYLSDSGVIKKLPSSMVNAGIDIRPNLKSSIDFFEESLNDEGHIILYKELSGKKLESETNSEAASYYLLWAAQAKDKKAFDRQLGYIEEKMLNKDPRYMYWKLNQNDTPENDGKNIATDADLRAIKALLLAEKIWKDKKYTSLINELASGLEKMAVTSDYMFLPYAGISGTEIWRAKEIWLSYSDFSVFDALSKRRGLVWEKVNKNMKQAILNAQIYNGLYNSMITEQGDYGNGIDGGDYSINSLWIMVRAAESSDEELRTSARKSLDFYKNKYDVEGALYPEYTSKGESLSGAEAPWVYALVGRAAVELAEFEFADKMIQELINFQITDGSSQKGAIPEGSAIGKRVGQFTMQESIITMQRYVEKRGI